MQVLNDDIGDFKKKIKQLQDSLTSLNKKNADEMQKMQTEPKITNCKTRQLTIQTFIYYLIYQESIFGRLCNTRFIILIPKTLHQTEF